MKKILFSLLILFALTLTSNASQLLEIPYKNIKANDKIKLTDDIWTNKVLRRESDYFVKLVSDGTGSYSEFYNSDGTFAFTTGSQYEFLYKGELIGYSNQDLKFYNFTLTDGFLNRRELSADEISEMFPDFRIIKISEFSASTNSLKIKKDERNLKIILLNDTDRNFYNYSFTSGNGKFETYRLTGFINITKKGMFQFSHFGDNTKNYPWFILLVR